MLCSIVCCHGVSDSLVSIGSNISCATQCPSLPSSSMALASVTIIITQLSKAFFILKGSRHFVHFFVVCILPVLLCYCMHLYIMCFSVIHIALEAF